MTKNTKTILLSLLACLLLITGFELGEGRIRFGSARLNDSTATYITTNKSFVVNGTLKATDSLIANGILSIGALEFDVSGTITFNYGSMIQEDAIDQLSLYAETHKLKTEYGTDLLKVDSVSGVGLAGARVAADPLSGQLLSIKTFRGVFGGAGAAETRFAHGVMLSKIISVSWFGKNDTIVTGSNANDQTYEPGYSLNVAFLYDTWIDSLYCTARLRTTSTGLFNDSLRCQIVYYQ